MTALEYHEHICDETYQMLLEENSLLKEKIHPLPSSLIEAKQHLIEKLTASVHTLKTLSATHTPSEKLIIESAQKKTLKILHLLKENEQLLLNSGYKQHPAAQAGIRQVSEHLLQQVYQKK